MRFGRRLSWFVTHVSSSRFRLGSGWFVFGVAHAELQETLSFPSRLRAGGGWGGGGVSLCFAPFDLFPMRTFLLSAIFAVIVSLSAFAAPPSLALVQFHKRNNTITISRGTGQTETIQVDEPVVPKNYAAYSEKLLVIFTNLYAEGYELKNSTVNNISDNSLFETVTYVFVKP
jgi:hypothetical protein